MLILAKIDTRFIFNIITSVTIISHNLQNFLQPVLDTCSNYQVRKTQLAANTSLWVIRLGHLPLSERRRFRNIYHSNFDAAKIFHKAERPSLLHSLNRTYTASYDEYTVACVSLHHCVTEMI